MTDQQQPYYALRTRRPADGSSLSSADSTYGSGAAGASTPAATHDVSRVSYHVKHLDSFAQTLQDSASRAFPNRGRSSQRYKKVQALLLHWRTDDLFVLPELEDLEKCFREDYGFDTDVFPIPSENSHLELMMRVGSLIKEHESEDTLFIVYYGGHARIDESRQSTWCATRHSGSPWLQWSAIQTLLERSMSDVLILLDCCAGAASATFPNGQSITETISASSWDAIAPDPGRYSFTNALIEVLGEWRNRTFSAAMLHAEVLARLKHPRPITINGKHFEARSTPVHFMMTANHRAPSIEMCRVVPAERIPPSPPQDPSPIDIPLSGRGGPEPGSFASEPCEDEPHVMISLALEDDQRLDLNAWELWLSSFPALAKYVKVQGVFKSHSTLLLLSMPVMVWDLLPEDQACSFVAFIRSNNFLSMSGRAEGLTHRGAQQIEEDMDEEATRPDTESFFSGTTFTPADNASTIGSRHDNLRHGTGLHGAGFANIDGGRGTAPRTSIRSGASSGSRTDYRRTQTMASERASLTTSMRSSSSRGSSADVPLRRATSAVLFQSTPGATPGMDSIGETAHEGNILMTPLLNQARSSRRTVFMNDQDVPEGPPLAAHVTSRLEAYFESNPEPSVATTEYYASHLGVETSDINLWFHHRRQHEVVKRNLQSIRIDDNPRKNSSGEEIRMILAGHLQQLLEIFVPGETLLLDLRSPSDFAKSHIHGAVNLRVPQSFLNIADFHMLERAFADEQSRRAFSRWHKSKCIVFYDRVIEFPWECPTAETLLEKFKREGWRGQCFNLKGHYREFAVSFNKYIAGDRMTQESKDFADSIRQRSPPTQEEARQSQKSYEEWLSRLGAEDRVPGADLDAETFEKRMAAVTEHQQELEAEFMNRFPELYKKARNLQPAAPDKASSDSTKGKGHDNFDRKVPFVEPLARGIEKMQDASGSRTGYSFPGEEGVDKLGERPSQDFDKIDPKPSQNDTAFQGTDSKLSEEYGAGSGDQKKSSRDRTFWKRLRSSGNSSQ